MARNFSWTVGENAAGAVTGKALPLPAPRKPGEGACFGPLPREGIGGFVPLFLPPASTAWVLGSSSSRTDGQAVAYSSPGMA